jgi:hypothetical protein
VGVCSCDVLTDRHVARHKEKDEEAGGEGLGRLQTRKRLWRDSTGAVVTKRRPEHEKKNVPSTPASKRLKIRDNSFESTNGFSGQKDAPMSPPPSTGEHISNRLDAARSSEVARESPRGDELWPTFSEDATLLEDDGTAVESFEFLCNASWGSQSQESTSTDVFHNGFFAPDTGG